VDTRKVLRSSNVPNKYELIIVAAKEARRINELSRQTGLNLGGKVTNVALEEALKGNVLYHFEELPLDEPVETPSTDSEE
jgi:DNA-directed RNA polymerase omega subunit